jgi:hypothetical protein
MIFLAKNKTKEIFRVISINSRIYEDLMRRYGNHWMFVYLGTGGPLDKDQINSYYKFFQSQNLKTSKGA